MMKTILLSIATAAVLSGAAFADPTIVTTRHAKVVYGDLNLSSESGVAVLYDRLQAASKSVCGVAPSENTSEFDVESYNRCTSNAYENAVRGLADKIPASYRTASK